jgi:hypothetical protein
MKVETGVGYLYAAQRAKSPTAEFGASTATANETSVNALKSDATGTRQVDFGSMTRSELRDWTNSEIRNGEISLDEGFPFIAMTMKIPVSGEYGGEVSAASDTERFDFNQKVRDGIEGALSRNDTESLKMLQSAMSIMEKYQGRTIGIDIHA